VRWIDDKPALDVAGEAYGAVGQATGLDTMRVRVEATKHNGASLIVVAHDPGVAGWCDRTVEVRDGRLLTGGVSGGVPVGMSGGVPGWVPDGRSGGTFGGVPGGTSGGVAGGTSGGVEGGMTGGVSA